MTTKLEDRSFWGGPAEAGDDVLPPSNRASSTESRLAIALLFVLAAHIAFVVAIRHEIWDGTIFDYWLATNDFRGIEVWYREANGFVTLWLLKAIHQSDAIVSLIFHAKLFNVLAIVLYPLGTFMILRFLGLTVQERLLSALVVSVSPVLLLYASMMNAIIMIYTAICWIGLSLLERPGSQKIVAMTFIVISCQLWSNFAVVIAFLAWRTLFERRIKWEYVAAALLASFTIYFLLFYFELSGPYVGYNSVANFSVQRLVVRLLDSSFAIAFWPVFSICVAVTAAYGLTKRRMILSHWLKVAGAAVFYISAAVPYLIVDKAPPPFGLLVGREGLGQFVTENNYDYRHLLPALPWLAVPIALTIRRLFDVTRLVLGARVAIAATAFGTLFLMGSSVANSVKFGKHLWQRDAETLKIVNALARSCDAGPVEGCVVDLTVAPHYQADVPRQYELNYLYFKAFGELGIVDSRGALGHAKAFAQQYACQSEAHARAYLTPFEVCSPRSARYSLATDNGSRS